MIKLWYYASEKKSSCPGLIKEKLFKTANELSKFCRENSIVIINVEYN